MSHRKALLLPILLFLFIQIQAQKWGLRVSYHSMKSYSDVSITQTNYTSNNTTIYSKYNFNEGRLNIGQRIFFGSFPDISVIREFNNKHAVSIGYRPMYPYIQSVISLNSNIEGFRVSSAIREEVKVHALKLNHSYTLIGSENKKFSLSTLGGVLLFFPAQQGFFSNGVSGIQTGSYQDSSGNTYPGLFIRKERTGYWKPNYPVPYVNLGLDFGMNIKRKFKLGVEFASYIGTKTLFIEKNKANTNGTEILYETKIRPYFFSGGLYLQYIFN